MTSAMGARPALLGLVLCAFVAGSSEARRPETAAATNTDPKTEEVKIPAGPVTLAARVYLPAGKGPFPAMVFTHGSGPSGRDSGRYQEEAAYFAAAGIASLVYDKRGYGESTGDWQKATFEDLAADALAAVRYLKARPDIDPKRVGLRGASQSGWLLPIAATRSADVAFLVLISPPGVTPYEQVLYDVRTDLEDAGFAPAEVEAGVAVTRSGLEYARSEQGWAEHKQRLDAAAKERWLEIASGPPDPDHWLWKWIRPVMEFDAVPLVEKLEQPVLVLLGEQDRETPSQVAGYRLARALRANRGSLVRYFPDGDHDLRSTTQPKAEGRAPFAAGYLETIRDWVRKETGG
jgi:hypothetical protein